MSQLCKAITSKNKFCNNVIKKSSLYCTTHKSWIKSNKASEYKDIIIKLTLEELKLLPYENLINMRLYNKTPYLHVKLSGNNIGWEYNNGYYYKILSNGFNICGCTYCNNGNITFDMFPEKLINKYRNYKNKHCFNCICKYCVCQSALFDAKYNNDILISNSEFNCGLCLSCRAFNFEYDSKLYFEIIDNVSDIYFNLHYNNIKLILTNDKILFDVLIKIICDYIHIDDIVCLSGLDIIKEVNTNITKVYYN